MDFERNELKKQQWQKQYEEANRNLQKAKDMIKKGKDWVKVLANAAAREELDLFIKEMERISYTAKFTLPSDIKNFETNAKLIFKSE